jgi:hypothetical protein
VSRGVLLLDFHVGLFLLDEIIRIVHGVSSYKSRVQRGCLIHYLLAKDGETAGGVITTVTFSV